MVRACYLCGKKANPDSKITLHQFPKSQRLKQASKIHEKWLLACALDKTDNVSDIRICSLHFEKRYLRENNSRARLSLSAVPSVNVLNKVLTHSDSYSDIKQSVTLKVEEGYDAEIETGQGFGTSLDVYDFSALKQDILSKCNQLPAHWGIVETSLGIVFSYFGDTKVNATRSIFVTFDLEIEVRAKDKLTLQGCFEKVTCTEDLFRIFEIVSEYHLCQGVKDGICCGNGFFSSKLPLRTNQCEICRKERKRELDRNRQKLIRSVQKSTKDDKYTFVKNLKRKYARLKKNMMLALNKITTLKKQCAAQRITILKKRWASQRILTLEAAIEKLPKAQQDGIKASLDAEQCEGPTDVRYSDSWILGWQKNSF